MTARGRYQGVTQIVSYNRGLYLGGVAAIACGILAAMQLHGLFRIIAVLVIWFALTWTVTSLAVSHYVYDRSELYRFDWLPLRPSTWANIHAGLDETTEKLRSVLTPSYSFVWDIFDAELMTEPSLGRARASNRPSAERVPWRNLPVSTGSLDAVFLMFVAHEFRSTEARHQFLREAARALRPAGSIVMVEHLRDVPNFLAYGPGFLHFQSRSTWEKAFRAAELTVRVDRPITPFVHAFELRKQDA